MRALILIAAILSPLSLYARTATRGEVRAFCETIEDALEGQNGGYELNLRKCMNGYIVAIPENGATTLEGVVQVSQPLSDTPDEQPWQCSMKYIGEAKSDNILSDSLSCN